MNKVNINIADVIIEALICISEDPSHCFTFSCVRGQDTEIVAAFFAGTVPRTPATISVSEPRSECP